MKKFVLMTSIVTIAMSASVFASEGCNSNVNCKVYINGTTQQYNYCSEHNNCMIVNGKHITVDTTDLKTKVNEFIQKCKEDAEENLKWLNKGTTEKQTQATTKTPVTEKPTKATTKAPVTEKPTEATTKAPVTEKQTEATTKAPVTEKQTEATTKAPVTEKPTQATTKAPVTEKPTKATTKAPVTEKTTETTTAAVNVDQSMAKQVLDLVNNARAQNGLSSLKLNGSLSAVAQKKAEDMKKNNYFSHTSPTYGSPFNMMKQAGISYKTAGENIAYGQKTAQEVFNAWMNSSGHRQNILNKNYKEMGLGVTSGGRMYWSQMFIG